MDLRENRLSGSFWHLNAAQFLGALNDNIFKLLVIGFIIGIRGWDNAGKVTALAGAVFVLPFLVFSAFAGKLADRFSKRDIIVAVKFAEVAVMTAALCAFVLGSEYVIYAVLFFMAVQSAFFSPSKYGIVPELVKKEQLSRANSFLEALTYLAIVLGAVFAPFVLGITGKSYVIASCVCVFFAVIGLIASFGIRRTEGAGSESRASFLFIGDIFRTLSSVRRKEGLLLAVFGSAYFLLIGAFIQLNLIGYGIEQLGFDETQGGYLFFPGAIGIGFGAYLAGRLSGRNIELGLVPLGAFVLAVAIVMLGFSGVGLYSALFLVFLGGVGSGLFIVPLHSFVQLRSPRRRRGQVIAASNFLGWIGVLGASGLVYMFSLLGISAAGGFLLLGIFAAALGVICLLVLPDFVFRFFCFVLAHLCYRIEVEGVENVPVEGGVLLVCNHSSWADPPILNAAGQRRIRFVMEKEFYNKRFLNPISRLMRAIPISSEDSPKNILRSLKEAKAALEEGFVVCIFAEGGMTRTGMLRRFKSGFERIVKGTGCKVVPVYIGGAWGSIFSYYDGRLLSRFPKMFRRRIGVYFGEPLEESCSAADVREKVSELSSEYFSDLREADRSLAVHFVKTARRHWRKRCISDSTVKRLNYGSALIGSLALCSEIEKETEGEDRVGILLPPSAGGVLANVSLAMLGKVTVNLNYTVSKEVRDSAVKQCDLKTVITSREFIERSGICSGTAEFVFLEDIFAGIGFWSKVLAYFKGLFLPCSVLVKGGYRCGDEVASIIFSSGSSGEPKGVKLSHRNIYCNIEAMRSVFRLYPEDNLCAVLPFFHSFGFTCSLWLPIISGVSAGYAANALDCGMVGRAARENCSTIIFAAPTFLINYIRRIEREDFASLRAVVVGAEKLKLRIADGFEEKFGIRPQEGYGATELSPVVSLNLDDFEDARVFQAGTKEGTVGHPLPGVAVKVVDAGSYEPVERGRNGILLVKGPNVMAGYLNREIETGEVLKGGWYNTGDIASIDEDGFLTITDRLGRFSKIGGEMVPHLGIEEVYLRGLGTDEQVVAVTGIPGEKRSEELVVLYVDKAGDAEKLHKIVSESSLPNIWKPRRENYIRIESIPALGSGKLDVMRLRRMAVELIKK